MLPAAAQYWGLVLYSVFWQIKIIKIWLYKNIEKEIIQHHFLKKNKSCKLEGLNSLKLASLYSLQSCPKQSFAKLSINWQMKNRAVKECDSNTWSDTGFQTSDNSQGKKRLDRSNGGRSKHRKTLSWLPCFGLLAIISRCYWWTQCVKSQVIDLVKEKTDKVLDLINCLLYIMETLPTRAEYQFSTNLDSARFILLQSFPR